VPYNTDMNVSDPDPTIGTFTFKHLTLRNSPTVGAKMTGWTSSMRSKLGIDLGAELDYTRFTPSLKQNSEPQIVNSSAGLMQGDLETVKSPITAHIAAVNLLVRRPFGSSPDFPSGRWYPYLGIGGGAEIAHARIEETNASATDTSGMWQALAGVKLFLNKHVAFFAEYKNTYAKHTFTFDSSPQRLTIHANHVVGGLAFHF